MTTATKKNTIVEQDAVKGAYDMSQSRAIIHHHTHGRLLLVEGFGGMDSTGGGMYRWKHGLAYKISETDTLESLFDDSEESGFTDVDALSPEDWSGKIIEKVAHSVGL